ncbi:MAG: UDP-2,3-diacylglucosamine diphosphatase [Pseudomonadota bacterium]|nr:UDP-2,3-diacylglucosamine diphosphatase [Pseudomonadota bacterium]
MTTLFISDLHLDESRPDITAALMSLLRTGARGTDALYILGDLFEAWIGDDDESQLMLEVSAGLHALAASGVPIYFMHGNRDFLLGAAYAHRCGMQLLDESAVVDLYSTPTLLLHGDTLCTADVGYLRFRLQVRQPAWQLDFLAKSLPERRAFAAEARAQSKLHTQSVGYEMMDVTQDAVADAFRRHRIARLIHGHTHRPAIHPTRDVDGVTCQRIVLGDWHHHGSVLRVDASGLRLDALPL